MTLRILQLEDGALDAELVRGCLARAGLVLRPSGRDALKDRLAGIESAWT